MLIRVFLFVQVLGVPALVSATTVVAVRMPTEIYLGVDSRVTEFQSDGRFFYHVKCKIGQVGKIFFAGAGPYGHAASGLDIGLSLRDAQRPGAAVSQTVERFEDLYAEALLRTLSFAQKESPIMYEKLRNGPVHVFLFAFENETPQSFHRIFTHDVSNSMKIHIEQRDCPPGCTTTEPNILGIGYADVIKKASPAALKTRPPIQFITEVIEASIKADPHHQSGGPIDILHLNKDGASWVQKKKECGEIQPYTEK